MIGGTPQIHPLAGDGNDDLIQVPPPRSPGTVASSRLGFFDGMRPKVRFATDSALEGRGFELSVPRSRERTSGSKSDLQEKPRPKHTSGGIRLPITRLPSLGAHRTSHLGIFLLRHFCFDIGRRVRARGAVRMTFVSSVHNPKIMLGMLVKVFCSHSIATRRCLSSEGNVTFENLMRVASDFDVRPVTIEGLTSVRYLLSATVGIVPVIAPIWSPSLP